MEDAHKMIQSIFFYILCSSLGGFATMQSARLIFEAELDKLKIEYHGPDSDGLYELNIEGTKTTVNLENVSKNFARDKDPEIVTNFVKQILNQIKIPSWDKAKTLVFFSAEPSDYNFGDAINYKVSDEVSKVLVLTDMEEGKITWISEEIIMDWNVSKEEVEINANNNMVTLLKGKRPEVNEVSGQKLGMIPLMSVFKAATIFSPYFKEFVVEDLGWPVFVVIPCRDFIYIIPEKDKALLNKIGGVVMEEFRNSGYPITTEVLRVSDQGIEAIGKFPE